jgi:hypothetical protein
MSVSPAALRIVECGPACSNTHQRDPGSGLGRVVRVCVCVGGEGLAGGRGGEQQQGPTAMDVRFFGFTIP